MGAGFFLTLVLLLVLAAAIRLLVLFLFPGRKGPPRDGSYPFLFLFLLLAAPASAAPPVMPKAGQTFTPPPCRLLDLNAFLPDHKTCRMMRLALQRAENYCDGQADWYAEWRDWTGWFYWHEWAVDLHWCKLAWWDLEWGKDPSLDKHTRLLNLGMLRDRIGADAYYRGELPFPRFGLPWVPEPPPKLTLGGRFPFFNAATR